MKINIHIFLLLLLIFVNISRNNIANGENPFSAKTIYKKINKNINKIKEPQKGSEINEKKLTKADQKKGQLGILIIFLSSVLLFVVMQMMKKLKSLPSKEGWERLFFGHILFYLYITY